VGFEKRFMASPTPPDGVKILTVGEFTRTVKGMLEETFPSVWIAGEISNLARPSSGHLYFKLKDSEAVLSAVIWRAVAYRLRFDLRDGLEVIARGRLTVYPPRGEYQLSIEEVQPKGIGAQELALRQLREKLFRLGYFARERKKPLPRFPRRIALVTSPTGAAVRDMLEILGRRWPAVEVWVCPAKMQGEGAAQEIATAVRLLNRLHARRTLPIDVMILGRGGGSIEDLWAFNEEVVAHAIFESKIPVVSAVGHEIDVTTADMVADYRAPTPSAAAKDVVPDRAELFAGIRELEDRLGVIITQAIRDRRERLDDLAERRAFRLPLERIRDHEQRLDDWNSRLSRAVRGRIDKASERLAAFASQLDSLSPLNVLARGYSLTRSETDLAVIRNVAQVRPGDRLITIVQHGQMISRVEEIKPAELPTIPAHGRPTSARMQT
jgi:exodeoxyribonuclease VII large subunit